MIPRCCGSNVPFSRHVFTCVSTGFSSVGGSSPIVPHDQSMSATARALHSLTRSWVPSSSCSHLGSRITASRSARLNLVSFATLCIAVATFTPLSVSKLSTTRLSTASVLCALTICSHAWAGLELLWAGCGGAGHGYLVIDRASL